MPYVHKNPHNTKWYALQSGGAIAPDVLGGPFDTKAEARRFMLAGPGPDVMWEREDRLRAQEAMKTKPRRRRTS